MASSAAHQSSWETSEVVFGIPLLISVILGFILHLPIAYGLLRWAFIPVGLIIFAAGVGFIIAARRELARHDQPTDPGRPTREIVKSGVFSISRNPLYLGIIFVVAGLGLSFNSWWIFIFLVVEIGLSHVVLVFPEERYLSATFGEEYKAYKRSVYRWLGRR